MTQRRHWTYRGEQVRLQVLKRDGYRCQIQGPLCVEVATVVDHIYPKVRGGSEDLANLRAACRPCNASKGTQVMGRRFFSPPRLYSPPRLQKYTHRNPLVLIGGDYSRKSTDA